MVTAREDNVINGIQSSASKGVEVAAGVCACAAALRSRHVCRVCAAKREVKRRSRRAVVVGVAVQHGAAAAPRMCLRARPALNL